VEKVQAQIFGQTARGGEREILKASECPSLCKSSGRADREFPYVVEPLNANFSRDCPTMSDLRLHE
jgi:hypothetical protein